MNAIYHVKPGVEMEGLDPSMAVVLDIVPTIFSRKGYDCWVTSAFRLGDSGKHGQGKGLDFDSSSSVPESTGNEIASMVSFYLGPSYYVAWHGPRWHLHVQKGHKSA